MLRLSPPGSGRHNGLGFETRIPTELRARRVGICRATSRGGFSVKRGGARQKGTCAGTRSIRNIAYACATGELAVETQQVFRSPVHPPERPGAPATSPPQPLIGKRHQALMLEREHSVSYAPSEGGGA